MFLFACLAAALVALLPISDPDLWWHLSGGRFIFEHAALPRADWLSYTMAGKAWADFEWLGEIVFFCAYRLGGLKLLYALKAGLFSLAAGLFFILLRRAGFGLAARSAALAAWAVCLIPRSDIRVELFSNAAFAALLIAVDWVRSGPFDRPEKASPRKALAACAAFFAFWANLHAGFAAGLLVLCAHAAGDLLDCARAGDPAARAAAKGRSAFFASAAIAGLAGSLLNPYGLGVHAALLSHAADSPRIARLIQEWGSLRFERMVHWPTLVLLLAAAAAFIKDFRERALSAGPWLAAGVFGLLCMRHARFIPYFATAGIPLVFRPLEQAAPGRSWRLCAAVVLACAAFAAFRGRVGGIFRGVWDDRRAPQAAAAFLERHPELLGRRMYNAWGWGGYLAFRFAPRLRVFQDGRYIFHPLFAEAASAAWQPDSWGEFLSKYGVDLAVVENSPAVIRTFRVYPDGSRKAFSRPFYAVFFPKQSWALLHFDAKALVFARRSAFESEYLSRMEFRVLRPDDEEAFADALRRGEIDLRRLKAERERLEGG